MSIPRTLESYFFECEILFVHYYPIFLKVESRTCLVVGGGEVGARKVKTLLSCGASVALVSPQAVEWLDEKIRQGVVELRGKQYEERHLEGCFLVIAATDDLELNRRIAKDAETHGLLCNVVDYPQEGNFILPALLQRGALTLAISTAGKSPALARQIREALEERFGPEYADFLEIMGAVRTRLLRESPDSGSNKEKFDGLVKSELLEMVRRRDFAAVDTILQKVLGADYSLERLEVSW